VLDDGRSVLVQPVLDGLGLGPLGHRFDTVAKVAFAIGLRARRGRSLRPVFLGPLLKLSLARALIPQLGVLSLKVLSLKHFLRQRIGLNKPSPVFSTLINFVPRAVDLLNIAPPDVHFFAVRLPCAHPDVNVRVVSVLVDHRKGPCLRKFLL
jgi:hypothetical protein